MRSIFIGGLFFGKIWKNMFFKVATAGLGNYHTGGRGPIGLQRVNPKLQISYRIEDESRSKYKHKAGPFSETRVFPRRQELRVGSNHTCRNTLKETDLFLGIQHWGDVKICQSLSQHLTPHCQLGPIE